MTFLFQQIERSHDNGFFTCGVDELDRWLCKEALAAHSGGLSRTHVSVETGDVDLQIRGYFTLCPTTVEEVGGSRDDGHPGYLLCKLARHLDLKGTDHGSELLVEAMVKTVQAANVAGGRYFVVDPMLIDGDLPQTERIRKFYSDAGFLDIEDSNRMFMSIKSLRSKV
ncbi:hypothetical protein RQCS_40490 [Rhodococcus qingshengii]|uniref:hypothetical protein n=1 Tax=Rhodococcus qingshengii TaxID=334542 RepID=UPI0007E559C5|nr:hypothetical protein [Rhodococcus qingshengii]BCF84504.1 hypothetical protein RQCS_40490 [Rhodococcus qingshengii]